MEGHIHDGALQGSVIFALVLLFGLAWHLGAMHTADKPIGKAMSIFY